MHDARHRTRTLVLITLLHGFTHVYQVALLPLYLLLQRDLKLDSVDLATALVTVMLLVYFVPSYFMGVLADRFSRKKLLGWGLVINALGFVGLAYAPNYPTVLTCVAVAGLGGSFYHPAATALVARLYPVNTGRALGLAGMGAGIGFFVGPLYAGWRASTAGWRAPMLELGLLGLVMAAVFFWLAQESSEPPAETHPAKAPSKIPLFPTPALWLLFLGAAVAFSLRDFSGGSMGSLTSLFLQKAHNFAAKDAGVALSAMFLGAVFSNPIFGSLSDRARIRWTLFVLTMSGLLIALMPHMEGAGLKAAFFFYGFFQMGSYPMVEAALMQAVPDAVRGRVFGLFITIGGLVGNVSHWAAGRWVHRLGDGASAVPPYFPLYLTLAVLVFLSLLGLPCLHALRRREVQLGSAPAHAPIPLPR
ncbi:MAG TPA: MFS transporter [Verrucomicrobiae bacterium]|jgi:MFS family permease